MQRTHIAIFIKFHTSVFCEVARQLFAIYQHMCTLQECGGVVRGVERSGSITECASARGCLRLDVCFVQQQMLLHYIQVIKTNLHICTLYQCSWSHKVVFAVAGPLHHILYTTYCYRPFHYSHNALSRSECMHPNYNKTPFPNHNNTTLLRCVCTCTYSQFSRIALVSCSCPPLAAPHANVAVLAIVHSAQRRESNNNSSSIVGYESDINKKHTNTQTTPSTVSGSCGLRKW